jgi:orotate phosphoribosyltransferase
MLESLRPYIQNHALTLAPKDKPFKLAAGGETSYYINMRNIPLYDGHCCRLVGSGLRTLLPEGVRYVGGVPTAGLLLIAPLLMAEETLKGFYVRKVQKAHGLGLQIEGYIEPDAGAALLEDTVTTGNSILEAVHSLREAGHEINYALALFDREEGAVKNLAREGVELRSLFKASDFGLP